jgi:hypothetical protein
MLNVSLNIHRVTGITISPTETYREEGGMVRATRTITICTEGGQELELTVFSPRVEDDGDTVLLEVVS